MTKPVTVVCEPDVQGQIQVRWGWGGGAALRPGPVDGASPSPAFETRHGKTAKEKINPRPHGPGEGTQRVGASPSSPRGLRSRPLPPPAEPLNTSTRTRFQGPGPWEGTPCVQWSLRLGQHPSRLTCSPGPGGTASGARSKAGRARAARKRTQANPGVAATAARGPTGLWTRPQVAHAPPPVPR